MQRDRITLIMPRAIVRAVIASPVPDNGRIAGETRSQAPRNDYEETVLRVDSVDPRGTTFRARPVWPLGEAARTYCFVDVRYVEPWDGEQVKQIGPFVRIPSAGWIADLMAEAGGAA